MVLIEFKTAFEVHFIHDYYLIDGGHRSFFELNAGEKEAVLARKLRAAQYDVRKDVRFIVSAEDAEKMRNYHLRLFGTPLGFKLAIEVKPDSRSDGEIRYRPAVPIPDELELTFGLSIVNPLLGNITNIRINEGDNQIYLFSNDGQRVKGTLSRPVPLYDGVQKYKMGDLVRLDGVTQEALEDNEGDRSKWQRISGEGFVNEADRVFDKGSDDYKNWLLKFKTPPRHPVGALKIKFKTSGTNPSIVDEDGFLSTRRPSSTERPIAPRFEVRLTSRRTYWRYLKKEGFTAEEIDYINLKAASFLVFSNETFVTRQPRFLSRALTAFEDSLTLFPNPNPTSFLKEGKRFFSDIYFNKVNPIP